MNYSVLLLKIITIIFIFTKFKTINTIKVSRKTNTRTDRFNDKNKFSYSSTSSRRLNVNNSATRCELPTLNNGDVKLRHRGKLIRFVCNKNYFLIGNTYAGCGNNGKWDIDIPVCVRRGCSAELKSPENGFITYELGNSIAHLYCNENYNIAGGKISYCNGMAWDRPIGTCRKIDRKNTLQHFCDFETDDICGWQQDDYDDFEWKRTTGVNIYKRVRTGPQHDHTTMKSFDGHYMLIESINRLSVSYARLISPIYPRNYSMNSCFRFWYHMYGTTVGSLRVHVKPLSVDMDILQDNNENYGSYLHWEKSYNQGNYWHEALFILEELEEDFQIVFEGTTGAGHLSDIAIDDVALLLGNECYLLETSSTITAESEMYDNYKTNDIHESTTHHEVNTETEETNNSGIIDVMTCMDRCNETESLINKLSSRIKLVNNGTSLLIICDCHMDCQDIDTCCMDYKNTCDLFNFTDDDEQEQIEMETISNSKNTYEYTTSTDIYIVNDTEYSTENPTTTEESLTMTDQLSTLFNHNPVTTIDDNHESSETSTSKILLDDTTNPVPSTTHQIIHTNSDIIHVANFVPTTDHIPSTVEENVIDNKISTIKENADETEGYAKNNTNIPTTNPINKKSMQTLSTISTTMSTTIRPTISTTFSTTMNNTTRNPDIKTTRINKLPQKNVTKTNNSSSTSNSNKTENTSSTLLIGIVLTVFIFSMALIIGIFCSSTTKNFNSKKLQIKFFTKKNTKTSPLLKNNDNDYDNVRYVPNDEELNFTLQASPISNDFKDSKLLTSTTPPSPSLSSSSFKSSSTLTAPKDKSKNIENESNIVDLNQFDCIGNLNDSNLNLLQNSIPANAEKDPTNIQPELKIKDSSKKKIRKQFNSRKSKFDDNNEMNQLLTSEVSNDDDDMWL